MRLLILISMVLPLLSGLSGQKRVTVAHYNVGAFAKFCDDSTPMVADMLREMGADAVSLNELDSCTARTGGVFQLRALCRDLSGWKWNFSAAMPFQGGSYGIGTAVRPGLKVLDRYTVALPKGEGMEPRALSVLETRDFVLCSTHLDFKSPSSILAQAAIVRDTLVSRYSSDRRLVVLCGDFNSLPESAPIVLIREDFDLISGTCPTHPNSHPRKCIDYIFILRNGVPYTVEEASVKTSLSHGDVLTASDHLPLSARIRFGGKAEWNWVSVGRGAQFATRSFEEEGGMRQSVSVLRYPMKEFVTEVASDPGTEAATTSGFGLRYDAFAAINAGYFNMKTLYPSTFVLDGGVCEGRTLPGELPRVDGGVVMNGHDVRIFLSDTLSYGTQVGGSSEAVAAGPVLLKDSKVVGDWPQTSFYTSRHPRSVIGTTADGWVYLIVIDGRHDGRAAGMTIPQTAALCRDLGLRDALNLDGGGSSALWTRFSGVISHPSGNHLWDQMGERIVPNAIIIR